MPINSLQRSRDPSSGKLERPSALAPYPRLELSGRSRVMLAARVLFLRGAKRKTLCANLIACSLRLAAPRSTTT